MGQMCSLSLFPCPSKATELLPASKTGSGKQSCEFRVARFMRPPHVLCKCTKVWSERTSENRIMGGTRCGFFGYGNIARQHPTGDVIRDNGEGKRENPALHNSQLSRMYGDALEQDSDNFVFRRHPACYGWNISTSTQEPIAGSIGQSNSTGACRHEGQLQLGAMALSNSGQPQVKMFQTSLNHSVLYTLKITTTERGSVYELLQADGTTLIERVTHTHRFCHNSALGRNIGLSRLPLPGTSTLDPTCTLLTPIEVSHSIISPAPCQCGHVRGLYDIEPV